MIADDRQVSSEQENTAADIDKDKIEDYQIEEATNEVRKDEAQLDFNDDPKIEIDKDDNEGKA